MFSQCRIHVTMTIWAIAVHSIGTEVLDPGEPPLSTALPSVIKPRKGAYSTENSTELTPEPPDLSSNALGRGIASKEVVPRKGVETSAEVEIPTIPIPVNMTDEGRKSSSARKGVPKQELSKPRKGVDVSAVDSNEHKKPLESSDSDYDESRGGVVALAFGLCVGLLIICVFLLLTVRSMKNAWNKHQYRRVDILVENMYGDS